MIRAAGGRQIAQVAAAADRRARRFRRLRGCRCVRGVATFAHVLPAGQLLLALTEFRREEIGGRFRKIRTRPAATARARFHELMVSRW